MTAHADVHNVLMRMVQQEIGETNTAVHAPALEIGTETGTQTGTDAAPCPETA